MRLILEAIKACIRPLRNDIRRNTSALTALNTRVDGAATKATDATKAAREARVFAETIRADMQYVFEAPVVDGFKIDLSDRELNYGDIVVIIPAASGTISTTANVGFRGGMVNVYDWTGTSIAANVCWKAGKPVALLLTRYGEAVALNAKPGGLLYEVASQIAGPGSRRNYDNIWFYGTSTAHKSPVKFKHMRVNSSTAGSSKMFDITVDDSGTITAVEVTT